MRLLVTGGAGFIGANFVRWALERCPESKEIEHLVVLDSLTYAGNLANLHGLEDNSRYTFVRGDIADLELVKKLLSVERISHIANFAAETHVDRSIVDPLSFVRANVGGTQVLITCAIEANIAQYVQVSTDEVYGSLGPTGYFVETTPLNPSSAYSASKAGGDLLVLAAARTHGLSVCVTRCTNNYGPYQFPEKLIPLFVTNALAGEALPVYGDGKNVRSWLHVDDHSRAIWSVLRKGRSGEVYNIGGGPESEKENIYVTQRILEILGKSPNLVRYVEDRKGHDRRYAVDYSKIHRELGWQPTVDFAAGLRDTVAWYVDNEAWWKKVKSGEYRNFYETYYGDRLRKSASR